MMLRYNYSPIEMMRVSWLLLCFVLFSLCNSYVLHNLKFCKRVNSGNTPNLFNLPGIDKFDESGFRLIEGDFATSNAAVRNAYIRSPKWFNGSIPYEINVTYTATQRKVVRDTLQISVKQQTIA
jgi:hypothetical protein